MSNTPEEILDQWIKYVNRLEVENVIKLYDYKSTLLPTFGQNSLSTPQQIKEYFEQLATRKNLKVDLHTETLKKYVMGENKYILMGIYSFHFIVDDARLTFPSRFTFILDISKENPILHHHSSQIPRTLS
jgi:hypothetical protein